MNPHKAYSVADYNVDDSNKPKLLLKVYQSMLDKLDIIKVATRNRNFEKRYDDLTKLITALEILDSSLDKSKGEVAKNLSDLYQYMVRRLLTVHTSHDVEILDECKAILSRLQEGFAGAYRKEMNGSSPWARKEDKATVNSPSTRTI